MDKQNVVYIHDGIFFILKNEGGLPMWLSGKESLWFSPDVGKIPGERNGNWFQYSCLGNPKDMEPGRLQSLGSQRVGHNLATRQQFRISN